MDHPIKNLPPSKRFNLLHHHHQPTTVLPAKKRVWAPPPSPPSPAKPTINLNKEDEEAILPAKKRAWVPPPPSPLKPANHNKDNDSDVAAAAAALPAKKRAPSPPPPPPPPKPANPEGQEADATHDDGLDDDDGIICAVCGSTDADPTDPIVFCDGCDVTVHSTCYGSPLLRSVPDGPWFCLRCSETPGPPGGPKCCLCPKRGGPLKPTVDGQWAHIVCALLVPEAFFRDPEGREGIDCSEVPLARRRVGCYVCGGRGGCGVECSEGGCGLGFHVSCGVEEGLCFEVREGKGGGGGIVAGFCGEHTKLWRKQQLTGKFKIVAREDSKKRKGRS